MAMIPKYLNRQLNDSAFLLRSFEFIKYGRLNFDSEVDCYHFMINFLVMECVAGINYKDNELMDAYHKIKKMVNHFERIYSEKLPLINGKQHDNKQLRNVVYFRDDNVCYYEKTG